MKKIYQQFKENFPYTLQMSGVITIFLILILFLLTIFVYYVPISNFFGVILFLLIIYLVSYSLIPLFYSFYFVNNSLNNIVNQKDASLRIFWRYKRAGKNGFIIKPFKFWKKALISLLIYFVTSIIVSLIYFLISQALGREGGISEFFNQSELILNSMALTNDEKINSLSNLLTQYQRALHIFSSVTSFFSLGLSFLYFIFKFTSTFHHFTISKTMVLSLQYTLIAQKKKFKFVNYNYNKEYFRVSWPYYLGGTLIFSGLFFCLTFLLPSLSHVIIGMISLTICLVILLPFTPILFNFNDSKEEEIEYSVHVFLRDGLNEANLQLIDEYKVISKMPNPMINQQQFKSLIHDNELISYNLNKLILKHDKKEEVIEEEQRLKYNGFIEYQNYLLERDRNRYLIADIEFVKEFEEKFKNINLD